MVYQGKPSQGCGTCRKRRIKCDLQRPICGQCAKSKRTCLGWRDEVDLMFVDQTEAIGAKATGRYPKRTRAPGTTIDEMCDSQSFGTIQRLPKSLTETTEGHGLSLFIAQFWSAPRYDEMSYGIFEHLTKFCSSASPGSPVFDATAAVGLATLAAKRQSNQIQLLSNKHYGKAVAALQKAVNDKQLCRSNETLMSIVILGIFETLLAGRQTFLNWGAHVMGSLALVRNRGEEMFRDPESKNLYWAVYTQAVYNSIFQSTPLEPHLDWERLWDKPVTLPDENSAIKLLTITSRLPALRAGALHWLYRPMSGEVAMKCIDLIGYAQILDQLIAGWSFTVPWIFRPRSMGKVNGTLDDPETAEFYPGHVDVYSDINAATIMNNGRASRAMCNVIIINCLERLYPQDSLQDVPEYRAATSLIQEMANGLCASVPYLLGCSLPAYESTRLPASSFKWPVPAADWLPSYTSPQRLISDEPMEKPTNTVAGLLRGHYLILPLFMFYPIASLPAVQRRWMAGRLKYIGETYGIGQATVLADLCPRDNERGRPFTPFDFAPPPYVSYPGIYSIVTSASFRDEEALEDLQPLTTEGRVFRAWRKYFLKRLLDL